MTAPALYLTPTSTTTAQKAKKLKIAEPCWPCHWSWDSWFRKVESALHRKRQPQLGTSFPTRMQWVELCAEPRTPGDLAEPLPLKQTGKASGTFLLVDGLFMSSFAW